MKKTDIPVTKDNNICIEGGILMKEDCLCHLFVPPEKSTTERLSDAVDDKLSKLFGRKKTPRKTVKEIRDKIILHGREQR